MRRAVFIVFVSLVVILKPQIVGRGIFAHPSPLWSGGYISKENIVQAQGFPLVPLALL